MSQRRVRIFSSWDEYDQWLAENPREQFNWGFGEVALWSLVTLVAGGIAIAALRNLGVL